MQLEDRTVDCSHILGHDQSHQVLFQLLQLVVVGALIVRQAWDAIVQLVGVGVGCIVDQHHAAQLPVQYPQVLHVDVLGGLVAVLPVHAVVDVLVVGVQVVDHHISVARVAGSEDYDFEMLRKVS